MNMSIKHDYKKLVREIDANKGKNTGRELAKTMAI